MWMFCHNLLGRPAMRAPPVIMALPMILCMACRQLYWELSGVKDCPQNVLNKVTDSRELACRSGKVKITIDKGSWDDCNPEQLLKACISGCLTLSADYPQLCKAKHADSILLVLWCTLTGLWFIMLCAYTVVSVRLIKHDLRDSSRFNHVMNKAKQEWARALQWQPWGVKVARLFALALFWYDWATDLGLLLNVWGHTWTGYALLVFLLYQYVWQGYVLAIHLFHLRKFIGFFETRLVKRLQWPMYCVFVLNPITTILMMVGLDIALVVSDLGLSIPFIDCHFDLEQYQLCRDIGRALFGTLPTAVLQSVAFATGSTPANGLVLTTQTFVLAIVGSELQLLKVTGELMYLFVVSTVFGLALVLCALYVTA